MGRINTYLLDATMLNSWHITCRLLGLACSNKFVSPAIVPLRSRILSMSFPELEHVAARPDRSEFLNVERTIFHLKEDSRSEVSLAIN